MVRTVTSGSSPTKLRIATKNDITNMSKRLSAAMTEKTPANNKQEFYFNLLQDDANLKDLVLHCKMEMLSMMQPYVRVKMKKKLQNQSRSCKSGCSPSRNKAVVMAVKKEANLSVESCIRSIQESVRRLSQTSPVCEKKMGIRYKPLVASEMKPEFLIKEARPRGASPGKGSPGLSKFSIHNSPGMQEHNKSKICPSVVSTKSTTKRFARRTLNQTQLPAIVPSVNHSPSVIDLDNRSGLWDGPECKKDTNDENTRNIGLKQKINITNGKMSRDNRSLGEDIVRRNVNSSTVNIIKPGNSLSSDTQIDIEKETLSGEAGPEFSSNRTTHSHLPVAQVSQPDFLPEQSKATGTIKKNAKESDIIQESANESSKFSSVNERSNKSFDEDVGNQSIALLRKLKKVTSRGKCIDNTPSPKPNDSILQLEKLKKVSSTKSSSDKNPQIRYVARRSGNTCLNNISTKQVHKQTSQRPIDNEIENTIESNSAFPISKITNTKPMIQINLKYTASKLKENKSHKKRDAVLEHEKSKVDPGTHMSALSKKSNKSPCQNGRQKESSISENGHEAKKNTNTMSKSILALSDKKVVSTFISSKESTKQTHDGAKDVSKGQPANESILGLQTMKKVSSNMFKEKQIPQAKEPTGRRRVSLDILEATNVASYKNNRPRTKTAPVKVSKLGLDAGRSVAALSFSKTQQRSQVKHVGAEDKENIAPPEKVKTIANSTGAYQKQDISLTTKKPNKKDEHTSHDVQSKYTTESSKLNASPIKKGLKIVRPKVVSSPLQKIKKPPAISPIRFKINPAKKQLKVSANSPLATYKKKQTTNTSTSLAKKKKIRSFSEGVPLLLSAKTSDKPTDHTPNLQDSKDTNKAESKWRRGSATSPKTERRRHSVDGNVTSEHDDDYTSDSSDDSKIYPGVAMSHATVKKWFESHYKKAKKYETVNRMVVWRKAKSFFWVNDLYEHHFERLLSISFPCLGKKNWHLSRIHHLYGYQPRTRFEMPWKR